MKKIDLLSKINAGEISLYDAEQLYDSILASKYADKLYEYLGLSRIESTAFLQGASFEDLARWRNFGFPNVCHNCHQLIQLEKFGWMLKFSSENEDEFIIIHLSCPDKDKKD